ncbi:MAG: hypothetical protein ACE5JI_02230 [Acidobacteriota bacterium]
MKIRRTAGKGSRKARVLFLALTFLAGGGSSHLAAQCAMCRSALLSSPEGQAMAAGFNQGILFLLAAPFLIVVAVGVAIGRAQRHRGRHQFV